MTYYDILGVPRYATPDQIKSAYREQMKFFHPDVFSGSPYVADVKSKQLNEAYAILSSPSKRYEYDRKLSADDQSYLQSILKSRDDLRAQTAKDKSDNEKYVSFIRSELEKSTRKYQKFRGFAVLFMFAVIVAFSIYVASSSPARIVSTLNAKISSLEASVESARSEGYDAGYQDALDSSASSSLRSEREKRAVWVTASGSKYHLRSCHAIRGHHVERTTLGEAEAAGYTACSKCNP